MPAFLWLQSESEWTFPVQWHIDKHHSYWIYTVLCLPLLGATTNWWEIQGWAKWCWKHEHFPPLCLPGTQSPQAGSAKAQVVLPKALGPVPRAQEKPAGLSNSLLGTTSLLTASWVLILLSYLSSQTHPDFLESTTWLNFLTSILLLDAISEISFLSFT